MCMMTLFDDLKLSDECLVSVAMREDGFLEVAGAHRSWTINKKLRELGYHRIATKPCGCADMARSSRQRVMKSHAKRDQRLLRLKTKDHQGPRPRRKPPSHL